MFKTDEKIQVNPRVKTNSLLKNEFDFSSVNLCLPDCSWVEERSFDLLPFDAGTDSGPTYMSPNTPTEPREPVRWITTKDVGSPFYDESTDVIAPLAKLVIRRKEVNVQIFPGKNDIFSNLNP